MIEKYDAGVMFPAHWLGGNCPVQAEGLVNNRPWYFRARGDSWSMTVGAVGVEHALDDEEWRYEQDYGDGPFDAGWMPEDEARGFIVGGILLWHQEQSA